MCEVIIYEMPKCSCGEEVDFRYDEILDGDNFTITTRAFGYCHKCKKLFRWKSVYNLAEIREIEEVK